MLQQILKEPQWLSKCPGKQYMCMHQIVYNKKLEHKYTLIPLDPRLLNIGPIQAKGELSFRDTCLDLYSYKVLLSVLCVLCLAESSDAGYLSVLCSIGQLPTRITQLKV